VCGSGLDVGLQFLMVEAREGIELLAGVFRKLYLPPRHFPKMSTG
jgi:hypothetical protein